MILPDVNVLIYAFRKDSPRHTEARAWLQAVIASDAHFGMSLLALSAMCSVNFAWLTCPSSKPLTSLTLPFNRQSMNARSVTWRPCVLSVMLRMSCSSVHPASVKLIWPKPSVTQPFNKTTA